MIGGVSDAGRPVAAVERAIALLDLLADGGGPRGVNELARALGAHASTVSRLLGTLAAAGLVERDVAVRAATGWACAWRTGAAPPSRGATCASSRARC